MLTIAPITPAQRRGLDDCARAEATAVNARPRPDAAPGDLDDKPWIHPDEWIKLRSPLVLLLALVFGDGEVRPEEETAVNRWIDGWLNRAYWGDYHLRPKERAIEALLHQVERSADHIALCAADCVDRLTPDQKRALVAAMDELADHVGAMDAMLREIRDAIARGI